MKLVINVDSYKLESCKRRKEEGQNAWYHDMVLNGKPLEKEIVKELNDIKAEIQGLIDFEESCCGNTTLGYQCLGVIEDRISELKGSD